MKKIFYILLILTLSASCSVEVEESGSSGVSDGTASSPMELTVGTAKSGGIAYNGYSYYKFTTSSSSSTAFRFLSARPNTLHSIKVVIISGLKIYTFIL